MMKQPISLIRNSLYTPLLPGLLGMALLVPGSYFMLAMLVRICFGATRWYYWISPSFLQSPFDLFALHKAQFIIGSVVLALLCNLPAIVRVRMQRGTKGLEVQLFFKRHWFNMAIALQSLLLLIALVVYMMIQHVRY